MKTKTSRPPACVGAGSATRGRSSGAPPAAQVRARSAQRSSTGRIAVLLVLGRGLEAGIDERRGEVGDLGEGVLVRVDDADPMLPGERDEIGRAKTLVAHLDDMAEREASTSRGKSPRNAAKSSASNFFVGMNCQLIGPSFSFSSAMPLVTNFSIDGPASASTRRFVVKREPLRENTKPSGVSSRQRAKLSGFCEP